MSAMSPMITLRLGAICALVAPIASSSPCPVLRKLCSDHPERTYCPADPNQHQCAGIPPPAEPPPAGTPHFHGCVDPSAAKLPYCDVSLPMEKRLDDLMSRLSTDDKIQQLTPQPNLGDTCDTVTKGKAEIGLPPWRWLQEANTNIEADCAAPGRCSTLFVGPLAMAASWNRTNWRLKGSIEGTEFRALNKVGTNYDNGGARAQTSLTGYGPNINIAVRCRGRRLRFLSP